LSRRRPGLRHSGGRSAVLQRLWSTPSTLESLHRRVRDLFGTAAKLSSANSFEDGEQTRDFVHVSDIVQANLLALETDRANYKTLNIGTGYSISITEISLMLAHGLNIDIRPEVTGKYREGDIRHCVADISRARTLLGYQPKVTLADGIPESLEWVRQQQAAEATQIPELEQYQFVR
jgi:nucleoside-diphosphate-sugar epimerase